ncbi:MAG: Na+/H+ antiporter subunit C [Actinobacteria bacterium]|nr:Na+/H+ antiporter subunit C [Actinomycetota bacterium]
MSLTLALLVGVLFGVGVYLMLHRTITRIVLGIGLVGNAVNLAILAASGRIGTAPIIGTDGPFADPIPQALVLTAIVIGFALQAFLLALAWRNWTLDGNDEVEDDLDDRRLDSTSADATASSSAEEVIS